VRYSCGDVSTENDNQGADMDVLHRPASPDHRWTPNARRQTRVFKTWKSWPPCSLRTRPYPIIPWISLSRRDRNSGSLSGYGVLRQASGAGRLAK